MRLTLSGGGFRATLFHLGVIRYLREQGSLRKVTEIYSVSGGSILAAHLVLNWEKYTASEAMFDEAAQEVLSFCRQDIRGRIVRQWLFSWLCAALLLLAPPSIYVVLQLGLYNSLLLSAVWLGLVWLIWNLRHRFLFISLLKSHYDQLYRKALLRNLDDQKGPKLFLLASNLTTGGLACFTRKGLTFHEDEKSPTTFENDGLPVSLGVAASSAFPPLFSPVEVSTRLLNVDNAQLPAAQYLSDGGVFDNLGLHAARLYAASDSVPVTAVSAERRFDWVIAETFVFPPTRLVRATDILMQRTSTLEINSADWASNIRFIKLSADRSGQHLPASLQRYVRNIRTDLNRFSGLEIQLLVYRGYCAARHVIGGEDDQPQGINYSEHGVPVSYGSPGWLPMPNAHKSLSGDPEKALKKSSRISFPYGAWHWKDLRSWVLLILIPANLLLLMTLLIRPMSYVVDFVYGSIPAAGASNLQWHVARASSAAGNEITAGRNVLQRELMTLAVPPNRCVESAHLVIYSDVFDSAIRRRTSVGFDVEVSPQIASQDVLSVEGFVTGSDKQYLRGPLRSKRLENRTVVVSCPPLEQGDRVVIIAALCSNGPEGTLDQDGSLAPYVQVRLKE